jgi:transcriptional regulator with XRE-family HTH domain
MTIGERIRLVRQKKGLSQKQLAEKSGVNIKSLNRYELGTSVPPSDSLKAISDTLEVSSDHLLSDEDTIDIVDKDLFKKFKIVQNIEGEERKVIDNFLDMVIRDFKTKQAYAS